MMQLPVVVLLVTGHFAAQTFGEFRMIPPWARTLPEQLEAVGLPEVKLSPVEIPSPPQRSWQTLPLTMNADERCLHADDVQIGHYQWRPCK